MSGSAENFSASHAGCYIIDSLMGLLSLVFIYLNKKQLFGA